MKQKEIWNIIADSWSNLRTKPDSEVIEFAKNAKGLILDVGCGNCRNLLPFLERGLRCFGVDFSKSMIKQAKFFLKKRNSKVYLIIADVSSLPFKNKSFDNIIYIRTLSTIEKKEFRLKSLKEIRRTAKKSLISAWKKWHWDFWRGWKLDYYFNLIKSGFSSDRYVDWNYHGKVYKRFYHMYTRSEFKSEMETMGFKIVSMWENREGNICAIVT